MLDTPIGRIENGKIVLPAVLTAKVLRDSSYETLPELPKTLQVDCTFLERCDSTGIAALVWLLRQAVAQDCRVRWRYIDDSLRRLLTLYQLDTKELIVDAGNPH